MCCDGFASANLAGWANGRKSFLKHKILKSNRFRSHFKAFLHLLDHNPGYTDKVYLPILPNLRQTNRVRGVGEEAIIWVSAGARLRILGDVIQNFVVGEVGQLLRVCKMLRVTHSDGNLHALDARLVDLVAIALQ